MSPGRSLTRRFGTVTVSFSVTGVQHLWVSAQQGWTAAVTAKSKDDVTALMMTSLNGVVETTKLLLDRGADVNAKDDKGHTALMWARVDNHSEIMNLLKQHRAEE